MRNKLFLFRSNEMETLDEELVCSNTDLYGNVNRSSKRFLELEKCKFTERLILGIFIKVSSLGKRIVLLVNLQETESIRPF